jgi:signal peptidase I
MQRLHRRTVPAVVLLALLGLTVYLSLGPVPWVVVSGDSMEPTLSQGEVALVEPVDPATIEEGDIVVVDVPLRVEEEYGYPDTIIHRVDEVNRQGEQVTFRTVGDNTGEDPFTIHPENVRAQADGTVPYVGYTVLYFRSWYGRTFLLSLTGLYALYVYSDAITRKVRTLRWRYLRPSAEVLDRVDEMESHVDDDLENVDESLDAFAEAMEEYAYHLESHTEAVQQMGDAAADIRDAVDRQNEMLERQNEVLDRVETSLESGDADERRGSHDSDDEDDTFE